MFIYDIFIFRTQNRDPVTYVNKNLAKSLYSNLSSELINRFFGLKLDNMV